MTPAYDTAVWLATHLTLAMGTSCFEGAPVDDNGLASDPSVFVAATGGPSVEEALGRGSSIWWPTMQVVARGTNRVTTQALARLAATTVTDKDPPSGYVSCDVLDSEPLLVDVDDKGRYYYSVNMRLTARRS